MSLSIDALRSFVVLAEELHFGRAAVRLHVSQPALTKQIKRLESDIGGRVFERTTGRVQLTPAGEALRERSSVLVKDATALESFARQAVLGNLARLRIGFGIAMAGDLLPRAVIAFRKSYPDVVLEMQDLGSQIILEGVLDGTLDIGFVRMPVSNDHLESTIVLREQMLLAVSAARFPKPVSLKSLRDEPFVFISRSTSETFQNHARSLCLTAGFAANVVQEAKETFTVLNLVRAGLGVTLVPGTARRMRVPGVRFYPLKTVSASWTIGMIWRKDRRSLTEPFQKAVMAARKTSITS
jgi:DNA-binding transcriptional LysR family regulator